MRQPDPKAVGERLLFKKYCNPQIPLSVLADTIQWDQMPEVDKDSSMQKEATKVYQAELQARIQAGDRFAKAVLEEGGWNEPTD